MPSSHILTRLFRANTVFMTSQREINAAIMNTFLGVAMWGGDPEIGEVLSINDLARRLGLMPSTVSRHLRYLGRQKRKGEAGLGLVETYESPEDARCKLVRLTPEGEALRERLLVDAE